jgi:protein CpxP
MEKTRTLTFLIIAMMILNAAVLGFIWLERPSHPSTRRSPVENDPGVVLAQYLGFSPQQKQRFDSLRSGHHELVVLYSDSLKSLKEGLYHRLMENDSAGAVPVIQAIGNLHQSIEWVTFDHFSRVRLLCLPEQRTLYDPMLHRAITESPREPRERPRDSRDQPPPPRRPHDNRRPGGADDPPPPGAN